MILDVVPAGECGAYIRFGTQIDTTTNAIILEYAAALRNLRRSELTDIVPGYVSLYVEFDVQQITIADVRSMVTNISLRDAPKMASTEEVIEIPVSYGGDQGPDLTQVAEECGLSEREVVEIHSAREYLVFFLGFTPGYPFMGIVDERIAVPRLAKPRIKVPAGSVGIAGFQTGIYPVDSPGGWRIIGRTTKQLADMSGSEPQFLLRPGHRARFQPGV